MSALPQPQLPPELNRSTRSPKPPLAIARTKDAHESAILRTTILGTFAAMLLVGTVLSICRVFEFATADLPRGTMFGIALATTIIAKFGRIAWRRHFGFPRTSIPCIRANQRFDKLVGYGSSVGLILVAVGCCYPAYRNSDWLIWLPMLIADQFWRQTFFDNDRPQVVLADLPLDEELLDKQTQEEAEEELANEHLFANLSNLPNLDEPLEDELDEGILQQLFRVREDDREVIYGTVRAQFETGQRHATVHVGFCPPLTSSPSVEAEACDFAEAKVKVAQAMAHGVRLDVRLSEPAEEACSVAIDLAATPLAA